jgi:signal transduction histidine kinase
MLLGDELHRDARESIELIEQAAERCRVIVQKLMKYSRKPAESDQVELIDLGEVIEHTISFLRYQLEQDNVRIDLSLADRVMVPGNANEFSQVFTNLIVNARDAVREIKPDACIQIRLQDRSDHALVEIEDNGTGISEEHLAKIFDPFFTTKDVGKGTGLGLSIVQAIVRKYKGRIDVRSKVGVGTTVIVLFAKGHAKAEVGHAPKDRDSMPPTMRGA